MATRVRHSNEVRRQEIIESARKLIAARGMEHMTTRELARAVGITEGAIYKHFQSKKEIIFGLIDEIEQTQLERIEKAKKHSDSPVEQLASLLREHLSNVERRRGVSFIVISEVLRSGDRQLRERMQAAVERYLGTIEGILEEGMRLGQVNPTIDPSAAAIALFGLVQGAVTLWHFASGELPLAERYQGLWQVYSEGVIRR
jgi:AcrR family transcriptional regulator